MNLEITVDHDSEEIHIVVDNHLTLTVRREINGELIYSRNFERIVDDAIYLSLKEIVRSICKHHFA